MDNGVNTLIQRQFPAATICRVFGSLDGAVGAAAAMSYLATAALQETPAPAVTYIVAGSADCSAQSPPPPPPASTHHPPETRHPESGYPQRRYPRPESQNRMCPHLSGCGHVQGREDAGLPSCAVRPGPPLPTLALNGIHRGPEGADRCRDAPDQGVNGSADTRHCG